MAKRDPERMVVCTTTLYDRLAGGRLTIKRATAGTRLSRAEFDRLVALPINKRTKTAVKPVAVEEPAAEKPARALRLSDMSLPKLVIMAKKAGLQVPSRPKRAEIIALIRKARK